MDALVPITYEGKHGDVFVDEAVVEYVQYIEDGQMVNDILNIFLPSGISEDQREDCKQQASKNFHDGVRS